jgi:hypothetical protein
MFFSRLDEDPNNIKIDHDKLETSRQTDEGS